MLAAATLACSDRRRPLTQAPAPAAPAALPTQAAPVAEAENPSCGLAGMPDCPLQAWMDARLNAAVSDGDLAAVARSLRELARDAPAGFGSWSRWADQGAEAADRQDQAGVQAACSGCHDENRETYRRTIRHRPVRGGN